MAIFRRSISVPLCRAVKSFFPRQQVRHFDDEFAHQTSTLNLLSREEDTDLLIEAYSPLGFRFNNNIHVFGPCAVFPRSILHWNVTSSADINENSLSLFCLLEPKLDLLILGVGSSTSNIDLSIIRYLRSKHISVEILPTEHACSTFNFLNSEHRCMAAGLIPPEYQEELGQMSASADDNVSSAMMGFKSGILEIPQDTEEEKRLHEGMYGLNNEKLWKQWYTNKRDRITEESDKYDPNEYLKRKSPSDPDKEK